MSRKSMMKKLGLTEDNFKPNDRVASVETTTEELMDAIIELAQMLADQEDAIIELAEEMEESNG